MKKNLAPTSVDFMEKNIIACRYCDLLIEAGARAVGRKACCPRCGGGLYHCKADSVHRSLLLVIVGLLLYIPANFFPIFILKTMGNIRHNTLFAGVLEFGRQGLWDIALLVFITSMLVPLIKLLSLLFVLVSLHIKRRIRGAVFCLRWYHNLEEWGMLGVFMLAMLVALTKLDTFARVYIGLGFYCFIGLLLISRMLATCLDEQYLWQRLEDLQ